MQLLKSSNSQIDELKEALNQRKQEYDELLIQSKTRDTENISITSERNKIFAKFEQINEKWIKADKELGISNANLRNSEVTIAKLEDSINKANFKIEQNEKELGTYFFHNLENF